MNEVNVGEGYRRLDNGEVLREGDQFWASLDKAWMYTVCAGDSARRLTYRRKLDATPGRVDAKEEAR